MTSLTGNRGPTGSRSQGKIAGKEVAQLSNWTPEMHDLFQQMFQHVAPESYLSKLAGGDESMFSQLEAPAMRQFSQLQGGLASRFSGMGTGARKSSGFQNTMSAAGMDLAERLQGQRMGLQQQALRDLMNMSSSLLQQRPYENFLVNPEEQEEPWWSKAAGIGLPIIGGVTGGFFGGPMGAVGGASAGSSIASALRGKQGPSTDWRGISQLPTKWGQ